MKSRHIFTIIFICFICFGFEPDTSAVTPARPESGNASGTSQQWIPDQVRDEERGEIGFENENCASDSGQAGMTRFEIPNNALINAQNPNSPIPQYPNNLYYYPWLEFPSRRVSIHPDSLPPNQGTDELTILFNAIGPYENSMLGRSLCLAGDQNEDGFDDIIAYCDDPPEVRLYFGGDPMDTIPDMIFPMQPGDWTGLMPTELADLNGDGDVDIVVEWEPNWQYQEVYVYYGGALLDDEIDLVLVSDEGADYAGFGYGMSCGDLNGDGYYDLAVGAPNYIISGGGGKIFIYFGGPDLDSIPDFSITSGYNNFGNVFGGRVSISGDVNNDGFNDIVCKWSKTSEDTTGVHLFLGSDILDSIPDWTYQLWYAPGQYNTYSSQIIKDLNNDNYDEIAVATMYGYGWEVHLFFGGETIGDEPDLIIPGGSEGPRKIKTAGNVNADGYNDMIMGSGDDSWVKVYYGGNPMDAVADITFYLPEAGFDVGFAGDVNGDGIHEFMFSAVHYDFYQTQGEIFIYSDPALTPHVEDRISEYQCNQCFKLHQNYPNPFNGATVIGFQSFRSGWVDLNIYNILGQKIYSLSHNASPDEQVRILWDGTDMNGNALSSGVYLVELTNGEERRVNKLQIIR